MARKQILNLPPSFDRNPPTLGMWAWRLAFALTVLGLILPVFHYLAYTTIFLSLVVGLADRRFQVQGVAGPFLILLAAGAMLWPVATKDGWKDLLFIASGIALSLVIARPRIPVIPTLLVFTVGNVYVAYMTGGLAHGFQFSLSMSESSFEGNFGFAFGLLCVYLMLNKRWGWAAYAFVMSVLALKRITLLAEIACFLLLLLPPKVQKRICSPAVMTVVNLLIVGVLLLYASHAFDKAITAITGLPPNQVGEGRQTLYAAVGGAIMSDPWHFALWGAGPGAAYDTIRMGGAFTLGSSNLHSDLIKIFFEYGALAFVLFFWAAYRNASLKVRVLFLFANILFVSDNVLIYHYFLFLLTALAITVEQEDAAGEAAPLPQGRLGMAGVARAH